MLPSYYHSGYVDVLCGCVRYTASDYSHMPDFEVLVTPPLANSGCCAV